MLLQIVLAAFILKGTLLQANGELISFEPVQYIKSHVSSVNTSSPWNVLQEASPQEMGEISASLKKKFDQLLHGSETNVMLAKGERIIRTFLSSKSAMDQKSEVPYSNMIAVLGTSMTILLETFQFKVINEPIGEILKGEDLSSPIINGYESRSFLDILNILSTSSSTSSKDSATLKDLERTGEVAMYFLDAILGSTAKEAWMDALLAYNIENYAVDTGRLTVSLYDLFQYLLTVNHDFRLLKKATDVYAPLQDQRYLFGWWLNCPKTVDYCIFPELPEDLVFSVSPTLRMYISPSFDLSLIVSNTRSRAKTFEDVVQVDGNIWKQIYSTLKPGVDSTKISDSETLQLTTKSNNTGFMVVLVHWAWPILLFLFWVVSSHVWVYWMLYCCWFVATRVSKRAHIPRPEVASGNVSTDKSN